jgi:para-nitrobenzyl esterase
MGGIHNSPGAACDRRPAEESMMNGIHLLGCAGALVTLAVSMAAPAASPVAGASPIVKTTEGALRGQESKGVYSFLGIHYGADTGGKNRFRAPQPPESWSGVRAADKMGNRCPQPPVNMPPEMASVLSFSDLPISEDCLVLNVWTPAVKDSAKLPVMVWLHGGGYFLGSGSDKYYEGSNLARTQKVVVVTLNHRLNTFGYLYLGPEAGPEFASSNLAGMLDLVAALKWVKANIAQFGGDPGNVTIFGQSGGGSKVSTLMAMPVAHGLFQKAIIESGAAVRAGRVQDATATRDKLLASLGIKPNEIARLQGVPMEQLMKAGAALGLLAYGPAVDGKLLPTDPFDPVASPVSADVPVMVGSTKDEATNVVLTDPTWQTMTDADLVKRVSGIVGPERAQETIALYRAHAPNDKPMHLWTSILTDQMFTRSSILLAERKAEQGRAPVYMYKINWETPVLGGKLRSPHAVELPFVFDNVDVSAGLVGPDGPAQQQMARLMSSTFAAFARTGNPDVPGVPHWPTYDLKNRETFIYDIPPKVVSDPNARFRTYWASEAPQTMGNKNSPIKDVMSGKNFK